ncbi:MAG: aminodeoxychorismate/anthranilate synthase component II [Thermoplasmata archaeon]|jgi:anthranilate synthase/aminodeoxychorismate synthase-like glutamine amidotransferase
MRILLIDHEDSFVYNVDQALRTAGAEVRTLRYTAPWAEVTEYDADGFVFSPGPGHPQDRRVTGLARRVLREYSPERSILGVCLGHQLIGEYFGGRVIHAEAPVHGATAAVRHGNDRLFRGVPSPFAAARYHSLVVDARHVPPALEVTASTARGTVMAMRHRRRPVVGVQFHPESYLTERGSTILRNYLAEVHR